MWFRTSNLAPSSKSKLLLWFSNYSKQQRATSVLVADHIEQKKTTYKRAIKVIQRWVHLTYCTYRDRGEHFRRVLMDADCHFCSNLKRKSLHNSLSTRQSYHKSGFNDFFRVQNQTSGTGNMSCVKKSPKRVCKIWFFIASALMISMQTYRKRLEYLRQHFLTSFDTDIFKICRFIKQIFYMHTNCDSIRSQTASLTALNVSLMFQNQS